MLPGHAPLLATLQVGEMWYRKGQETHYLVLAFGFVEVLPDKVTVLAQIAEKAEEIDLTRAEAAKVRAEQRISGSGPGDGLRACPHRDDEVAGAAAGGVANPDPLLNRL